MGVEENNNGNVNLNKDETSSQQQQQQPQPQPQQQPMPYPPQQGYPQQQQQMPYPPQQQMPYPPQQQPMPYPPQQGYPPQQQYSPQQGYPPQQYQQQPMPYPPPNGAPQQAYMAPQPVVVQSVTTVTPAYVQPVFRDVPVDCICGHCQSHITTKTSYKSGSMAWLVCILLIIFGCWLGCCLIPFAIDSLKDVQHKCPTCKKKLYRFDRMNGK